MCESQRSKNMQYTYIRTYMHAYTHTTDTRTHTYTFSRPQKTSRPDRKFFMSMAARSGLNIKIYRTPMLTTRAQGGGRTSSRSHAAKRLFRQLEPMADAATPFSEPYHQAPFWKFRYVSRCRSLSSTSSLFSGISCSPVRRRTCMLVANRPVPPRAHTPPVFLQTKTKEKLENVLNRFCISSLRSLSSNAQTCNHSKPSRPLDLVSFIRMGQKHEYMHQSNQCH